MTTLLKWKSNSLKNKPVDTSAQQIPQTNMEGVLQIKV